MPFYDFLKSNLHSLSESLSLISMLQNFKRLTDTGVRVSNLEEDVQTYGTAIDDLEDKVDLVEDAVMALEVENTEIQQRLTTLEETVISTTLWSFSQLLAILLSYPTGENRKKN